VEQIVAVEATCTVIERVQYYSAERSSMEQKKRCGTERNRVEEKKAF
jgi:hypothetical protein